MKQARTITLLVLFSLLITNALNAQKRANLHVYGDTYAVVDADINWEESAEEEAMNIATTVQTNLKGDQVIIQTNMEDVEQVLIFDMNGMLYDTDVVAQSNNHVVLSFENIQEGQYFISLERASGHESFQVSKSSH